MYRDASSHAALIAITALSSGLARAEPGAGASAQERCVDSPYAPVADGVDPLTHVFPSGSVPAPDGHGGFFGYTLSAGGDVDGDGLRDLLIGDFGAGTVHVAFGVDGGLPSEASAAVSSPADLSDGSFAWSLSEAGDVDGDGYGDVIIGELDWSGLGLAHLFYGGADGLSEERSLTLEGLDGVPANTLYGAAVSGAGDVNGDGYDDIIVGALGPQEYRGAAYVYFGAASGVSPVGMTLGPAPESDYGEFGYAVAGAGDVDSDGYDDIIVGMPGEFHTYSGAGGAYLFYGSATGPMRLESVHLAQDAPGDLQYWGWSVTGAGDLNADGYADFAVGSTWISGGDHTVPVTVYLGGPRGTLDAIDLAPPSALSTSTLGAKVSGAGDFNGDGYDDLVVSASAEVDGVLRLGAFVYAGSDEGVSEAPAWWLQPEQVSMVEEHGVALSGVGDLDGDGFGDVAIGSNDDRATIFRGCDQFSVWYADADGDGYGTSLSTVVSCAAPDGYTADSTDCDDTSPDVHPDAEDIPKDDIDQDCDGADARRSGGDRSGCAVSAAPSPGLSVLLLGLVVAARRRRP